MTKSLRLILVSLFLVCLCALSAMAQSQASTGQIVGTVKNPNGELVPGATVTVTNPANGYSRTFTTNDQGVFTAANLPSGDYTIDIEAPGFGKFTQTGYKVEVGSALTAELNLSVQAVTGTVLVSAGSNVETTQTQNTTNINDTSIAKLPINGRRFQDFVLATPTAQIDPSRDRFRWLVNAASMATFRLTALTTTTRSLVACAAANVPIRLLRFRREQSRSFRLSPPAIAPSSAAPPAVL